VELVHHGGEGPGGAKEWEEGGEEEDNETAAMLPFGRSNRRTSSFPNHHRWRRLWRALTCALNPRRRRLAYILLAVAVIGTL